VSGDAGRADAAGEAAEARAADEAFEAEDADEADAVGRVRDDTVDAVAAGARADRIAVCGCAAASRPGVGSITAGGCAT
jgi:hypothetical protein